MEENENKDAVINKDEIKEETVKTAQEVKEAIKNVDIKNDAKATTGFIKEMFKNPLARLKNIAEDNSHKDFKFAIVLVIVWMVVILVSFLVNNGSYFHYNFGKYLLALIKAVATPIISLVVMSAIVFFINKNNKKSFVTVLTGITAAKIPVIIARILGLLTLISSSISKLLSPVSTFCSVISVVCTFFAIKAICGEEDNSKFLKTFIIIEAIFYVAYLLISYLEIYI